MEQCIHHWIIDRCGNARCRHCPAATRFLPEKIEFDHMERTLVEQYRIPSAFWQTGSLHGHLGQVDSR